MLNQQIADEELSTYKLEQPAETPRGMWVKRLLEKHQNLRTGLLLVVLLGTCMVIGDGILTPSISGTSLHISCVPRNQVISSDLSLLLTCLGYCSMSVRPFEGSEARLTVWVMRVLFRSRATVHLPTREFPNPTEMQYLLEIFSSVRENSERLEEV